MISFRVMKIYCFGIILIFAGFVFPVLIYSQNSASGGSGSNSNVTIPEWLRRPLRGEAPRYPRDRIIGELGQGTAPYDAWQYARLLMSSLLTGNRSGLGAEDTGFLNKFAAALEDIEPVQYRLGGGRFEEDGAVSFLVRFLGRERWIAGELYLLLSEDDIWYFDDLFLEEGRIFDDVGSAYQYDFSPYERFF